MTQPVRRTITVTIVETWVYVWNTEAEQVATEAVPTLRLRRCITSEHSTDGAGASTTQTPPPSA